jgi:hypothetical protein
VTVASVPESRLPKVSRAEAQIQARSCRPVGIAVIASVFGCYPVTVARPAYFRELSLAIPGVTDVKAQPRGKRNMSSSEMRNGTGCPPGGVWTIRSRE